METSGVRGERCLALAGYALPNCQAGTDRVPLASLASNALGTGYPTAAELPGAGNGCAVAMTPHRAPNRSLSQRFIAEGTSVREAARMLRYHRAIQARTPPSKNSVVGSEPYLIPLGHALTSTEK